METVTEAPGADISRASTPPHPKPRAVPLTFSVFAICIVALFASAIAICVIFFEADGGFIWAMAMMAAVIMVILLSSVMLPYIKELREHRG